jgi:hypothetical protein
MDDVKEVRLLIAEGLAALETALLYVEDQKHGATIKVLEKRCDFVATKPPQFQLSLKTFLHLERKSSFSFLYSVI